MHEGGDKWDVFVVGVRDANHANTVAVAAQLAKNTGMPTADVELALMKGDVRVRAGLLRPAAENAAMELDALGAIVDLRMADGASSPFSELKPDASRRAGVAVGGFIDDSATPPAIAESSGLTPVPLEPDPEGLPPPPPMGVPLQMLEDIASEPIRLGRPGFGEPTQADYDDAIAGLSPAAAAAVRRDASGMESAKAIVDVPIDRDHAGSPPGAHAGSSAPSWVHDPPPDPEAPGPTLYGIPDEAEIPPALLQGKGRTQHGLPPGPAPRPDRGSSRGSAGRAGGRQTNRGSSGRPRTTPASARPILGAAGLSQEGMIAGLEALEVTDLPTAPATPSPAAADPPRPSDRPPRKQTKGPVASPSLELDYAAVGAVPKASTTRGAVPVPGPAASASMASPSASYRSASSASAGYRQAAPEVPPTFLLGRDEYTAIPAGLTIGLALSLFVAIQLQRGPDAETLEPLEEELQSALSTPARVAAGEVRSPASIEEALEEAYGSLRRSFLLKWLAIGLPIGFGLSRIRRRV